MAEETDFGAGPYYRLLDAARFVDNGTGGTDGAERFASTRSTEGPWSHTMQHGSPPAALLTRALERCEPRPGTRLARIAVELLGPVPVDEVTVRARVDRPGRRVELITADLEAHTPRGVRTVARAHGWRIAVNDSTAVATDEPVMPPRSDDETRFAPEFFGNGFVESVEVRAARGDVDAPTGPLRRWVRTAHPLVEGQPDTPAIVLVLASDLANGVGARTDPRAWTFLNTDLTLHITRLPEGEWIGVEAETSIGPDGIGVCRANLYDERGRVASSAQILEVRPVEVV